MSDQPSSAPDSEAAHGGVAGFAESRRVAADLEAAQAEQLVQAQAENSELPELKVVLADTSDDFASRVHQKAREDFNDAKLKAGIFRRAWLGMTVDRQILKLQNRAASEFRANQSVFENDTDGHKQRAEDGAIVRKIEAENEALLDNSEEFVRLDDTPEGKAIKDGFRGLISEYVQEHLGKDEFESAKDEMLRQVVIDNPELIGQGLAFAENLTDIAEQVKLRTEVGHDLQTTLESIQFILAETREHLRTEVELSACERIIERLGSGGATGYMANETTLAAAVSIAYSIARWSSRSVSGVLSRMTVVGVGAGGMAALRVGKEVKYDRSMHGRQSAVGGEITAGSKRREQLEQFRVEARSANELREQMDALLYGFDSEGKRVERPLDESQASQLMNMVAEITSRRQLSDREQVDLIGFTSTETAQQERLELYLMQAEATVRLRSAFEASPDLQQTLGGLGFDEALAAMVETHSQTLGAEIIHQDARFSRMRHKEMAKAFAKGLLTGAVVGVVAQEATSLLRSDQQGLIESWMDKGKIQAGAHETLLRGWFGGAEVVTGQRFHDVVISKTEKVTLPEGWSLRKDGSSWDLLHGKQVVQDGVKIHNGALDAASQKSMQQNGIGIITNETVVTKDIPGSVHRSPEGYAEHHAKDLAKVHRQLWYDNNTPRVFDKNELGLWWGGQNGIDSGGNYVFNVSHMTPGGSSHGAMSADAQRLYADGKMKIFLSMSRDTQRTPFMIDIDARGNAIIPKDSEAGRLLFRSDGGRARFLGRYAEAAQVISQKNGVINMRPLATYEGKGISGVTDHIIKTIHTKHFATAITPPADSLIDVPPIIPISARKGLEELATDPKRLGLGSAPERRRLNPAPERRGLPAAGESTRIEDMPAMRNQVEKDQSKIPLLSLFEVKELARKAVAEMKKNGRITPTDREEIGGNIGRITQRMNKREVEQSDLFSLFTMFHTLKEADPDFIPVDQFELIQASIIAADKQLISQSQTGWAKGSSAPTVYPAKKPFEVSGFSGSKQAEPTQPTVKTVPRDKRADRILDQLAQAVNLEQVNKLIGQSSRYIGFDNDTQLVGNNPAGKAIVNAIQTARQRINKPKPEPVQNVATTPLARPSEVVKKTEKLDAIKPTNSSTPSSNPLPTQPKSETVPEPEQLSLAQLNERAKSQSTPINIRKTLSAASRLLSSNDEITSWLKYWQEQGDIQIAPTGKVTAKTDRGKAVKSAVFHARNRLGLGNDIKPQQSKFIPAKPSEPKQAASVQPAKIIKQDAAKAELPIDLFGSTANKEKLDQQMLPWVQTGVVSRDASGNFYAVNGNQMGRDLIALYQSNIQRLSQIVPKPENS